MNFVEKKEKGLLGLTHVWEEVNEHGMPCEEPPFQIRADEAGVKLTGNSLRFSDMEALQLLAATISAAWEKYGHLRPKPTNLAGH